MGNKFTEEQLKAIETTDKSVLVSAAAGSGKTSVLVERIIRIILSGKADVDEMLVVTFTNAAASEMRLRLARAIRSRLESDPDDETRIRLKAQLAKLYRSYISTINSFAGRVIKEFFHEIDIDPGASICDEVQSELLKREAVSELFEEAFAKDDLIEGCSFRAFLRLYSEERSEDNFMDGIISSYDKLRSMPDYFEWAFDRAEMLRITEDSFDGSELQRMMAEDARETFNGILGAVRNVQGVLMDAGFDAMADKMEPQAEWAMQICEMAGSGRFDMDTIALIEDMPKVTLRAAKDEKESYELIKGDIKKLRDSIRDDQVNKFKHKYLTPDFASRLREMNATYEYTVYYIRLLEEFEKRYDAKKREQRVMDFSDQEHFAVRILKNEEAAGILRRRFKYIFVDEYQDTNNIQERLISSIARPDNVFRVGDVKQSIYKFRQAEPEIFERLYARFGDPGQTDGIAVDLGRNFRTNDRTIGYINYVFEHIMEGYDERARLYTGLDCEDKYDFMPEVHVLFEESGNTDSETDDEIREDLGLIDEEIEDISKEEAEAAYIADPAASIIGTEFYDTKAGVVRKAEARDIAILLRAVKVRGEVVSRALRERAIEPHLEESEDLFDTVEIGVALSLLQCIDNMKRDLPLISVLHSEIFGFSPEELAQIRIAYPDKYSAYHKAFGWYADEGPEGELRDKACAARGRLLEWRRLSRMMPLEDFVWHILTDSGYYRMAGAMPGGARRQANLRSLADRAALFSKDRVASLSSFITFLDTLRGRKAGNGQIPMAGRDDDVVRISTIHKSKGLEYPFVIVGGLGHRFRDSANDRTFSFDSSVGVGLPYIDPSRKYWRSTIMQRAISAKSKRDDYREELRLLYVAMTRARNKLYMVGTAKSEEDLAKFSARPGCFIKAMKDVIRSPYNTYHASPLMLTKARDKARRRKGISSYTDKPLTPEEQRLYDEIDRRFSFRYPDEELLTARAKYSVSAIRQEELKAAEAASGEVNVTQADDEVVHLWRGSEGRRKASAADTGIAYHRIMEFLDFTKALDESGAVDEAYINERAELLRDQGAVTEDVYRSLDLGCIASFFAGELGQRAVRAAREGRLRREKPFTLRTERGGREMLVQGVIDCCFEEDGRMVLVDYKSSFIHPGRDHASEIARIRDEYRVQIELYSEALSKGSGREVAEAYLYLFATGEAVDMLQSH